MFWQKKQSSPCARRSVQEDWIAQLSREKHRVYESVVRQWEDAYAVLSVALNEALSHRGEGELVMARKDLEIAAAVVNSLAEPLLAACQALQMRGRHLSTIPSVNPLTPGFFRGEAAQQNAAWNQLLHRVLFGSRARYLHKLRTLEITVSSVAGDFQQNAEDLACGVQIHPLESWSALDTLHYDLNTCLRETVIILKSFLRAVPDASLEAFRKELDASTTKVRGRVRHSLSGVSA